MSNVIITSDSSESLLLTVAEFGGALLDFFEDLDLDSASPRDLSGIPLLINDSQNSN